MDTASYEEVEGRVNRPVGMGEESGPGASGKHSPGLSLRPVSSHLTCLCAQVSTNVSLHHLRPRKVRSSWKMGGEGLEEMEESQQSGWDRYTGPQDMSRGCPGAELFVVAPRSLL